MLRKESQSGNGRKASIFCFYEVFMAKRFAIIDGRAEGIIAEPLRALGYNVLSLPPFDKLDVPVSAHPDMLLWAHGRTVITHREYYPLARTVFDTLEEGGYEIILSEQEISKRYPADVPLNCAVVGKFLIANTGTLSPLVEKVARESSLSVLHVNQGYAKCSTFIVDESSVITADTSIANACLGAGLDVLKICEGNIRLDGYGYGFIGGAGGVDESRIFFAGDPAYHPDGASIIEFCKQRQKEIVVLADTPLFDVGTIFFF